jgi:hypothetical protein
MTMAATIQDRRTPEQKNTHTRIVQGVDRALSGWGGTTGGTSVAAWACRPEDLDRVAAWVRDRRDLDRVTVADAVRVPRGCAHYSLYVVHDDHPARGGAT